ncbi:uncharacterized protein LOC135812439 [Sycon ciliatum]|uniref:uncharacterized protein LOC135812439 n=1 Tax=Sycon ciliatum TaxID=27933 RepID=UPI0031F5FABE
MAFSTNHLVTPTCQPGFEVTANVSCMGDGKWVFPSGMTQAQFVSSVCKVTPPTFTSSDLTVRQTINGQMTAFIPPATLSVVFHLTCVAAYQPSSGSVVVTISPLNTASKHITRYDTGLVQTCTARSPLGTATAQIKIAQGYPVSIYPVRASMVLLPSGGTNSSLLVAAHGTPLGQHVVCVFVADGSAPQCGAWTDSYASSSLVMVDTPSVKATLEFTAPTLTCPGSFHIVVTRPLAANQPTVTVTTMLVNPFPIFGSAPPVSTYSHEVGTPVPASRDYPATC